MGVLNTRKNKKFSYEPRYYKGEGSPYEMKGKFDAYRSTLETNKGLKGKFTSAWDEYKTSGGAVNKTIILIAAILIFIFLWIIDFDLSIFSINPAG